MTHASRSKDVPTSIQIKTLGMPFMNTHSHSVALSLTAACALTLCAASLHAQDAAATAPDPWEQLMARQKWIVGPGTGDLIEADVAVSEGYIFTGGDGTRDLLSAMGNIVGEDEVGFLMSTNSDWFVVFEFSESGYVKDDDKDELDAAKLLKAFKEGNEYANEERAKMGVPPLTLLGWEQEPRYNETTHNLEWALRLESEGELVVNYNTRLLGRRGVMEVNLVIDPAELRATLPTYQDLLSGYQFKSGETYAEYRQGDKVAQYGLAALVLGGAAAGAAKLGVFTWLLVFLKKGWKLVVFGIAAIGVGIKKIFFGGRSSE
jgi:uncharacterized membrane-anchored protein